MLHWNIKITGNILNKLIKYLLYEYYYKAINSFNNPKEMWKIINIPLIKIKIITI